VVTFDARFFPVYLTPGMLVLLLELFLARGVVTDLKQVLPGEE
jgi:hypothetical protein